MNPVEALQMLNNAVAQLQTTRSVGGSGEQLSWTFWFTAA